MVQLDQQDQIKYHQFRFPQHGNILLQPVNPFTSQLDLLNSFFLERTLTVDGFLLCRNMTRSHISFFFKDSISSSMALFQGLLFLELIASFTDMLPLSTFDHHLWQITQIQSKIWVGYTFLVVVLFNKTSKCMDSIIPPLHHIYSTHLNPYFHHSFETPDFMVFLIF